jgi:hypothetical protein
VVLDGAARVRATGKTPGRVAKSHIKETVGERWCRVELCIALPLQDAAGSPVRRDPTLFDLFKQLRVTRLDGHHVLRRPGRGAGRRGDEVAALAPRWQTCHLGTRVLLEIRALPRRRLLPSLPVRLELEDKRNALARLELAALHRRQQQVLELIGRGNNSHGHFHEAELERGLEAEMAVKHHAFLVDVQRNLNAPLLDVVTQRDKALAADRRDNLCVRMRSQLTH